MFNWLKRDEVVSCEECKCLMKVHDSNKVSFCGTYYRHYCLAHKKSYTRTSDNGWTRRCYRELEVNEQGEPIGYVKEEKKATTFTSGGISSFGSLHIFKAEKSKKKRV